MSKNRTFPVFGTPQKHPDLNVLELDFTHNFLNPKNGSVFGQIQISDIQFLDIYCLMWDHCVTNFYYKNMLLRSTFVYHRWCLSHWHVRSVMSHLRCHKCLLCCVKRCYLYLFCNLSVVECRIEIPLFMTTLPTNTLAMGTFSILNNFFWEI